MLEFVVQMVLITNASDMKHLLNVSSLDIK